MVYYKYKSQRNIKRGKSMKVILTKNVKNVGKLGDVVDVSDGYANNFLLKQKLAVLASSENVNSNTQKKNAEAKRKADELVANKELAKVIEQKTVTIKVTVGKNGQLFGSVTNKEISDELAKQNIVIDKKKFVLDAPIRTVGVFNVKIKLCAEVTAKLKVLVEAE